MLAIKKKNEDKKSKPEKKNSYLDKIPGLTKLRIIVGLIFGLSTLSLVLILVNSWALGGFLVIISYILVIILTIKVFFMKNL